MSKKIPLAVAIALILVFSALTVFLTVSVYLRSYNKYLKSMTQLSDQYSTLSEIEELLRDHYDGEIDSDAEKLYTAKGYVEGLKDPNSAYLSAEEYGAFASVSSGHAAGVGLSAGYSGFDNSLTVTAVSPGSAAASAGIAVGDRIISVDGKSISVNNFASILKKLQTDESAEYRVTIRKNGADGSEVTHTLSSGFQIPSVSSSSSGVVGYIRISAFYDDTPAAFTTALTALNSKGIASLIVDVRNTSGTNYDAAAKVIDMLVPLATEGTGAIATAINASGEKIKVYSADAAAVHLPMAVLMNDRTGAAGELLAADLRDFHHAVLVGEKTAGNAGVQEVFPLEDGSALILTVAKIYPYISESFDDTGISPDIEIVFPPAQKDALDALSLQEDAQYLAAVSALNH